MLQWNRLHPYNAVHAVRVSSDVSPECFRHGIEQVLDRSGWGRVSFDLGRGLCRFHPGRPAMQPRVIGENALEGEIESQLNEPFPPGDGAPFVPFRFFCGPGAEGSTWLGLGYFHALADADSITRLLLEISGRCTGRAPGAAIPDALLPGQPLKAPLGNPWQLWKRSLGAVLQFQRMRGSHRPPFSSGPCSRNRFQSLFLSPAETAAAMARARHWEVTLNDLFLAALLLAVAPLAGNRFPTARSALTAACVVNLRGSLPSAERERFGLCLGTFTVTHPVPEGIGLETLAREIHAETSRIKKENLSLGAALTFRASRFMLGRLPLEKQRNFYRKSYPVWGSVTNLRVDALCQALGAAETADYLRAVSVGPAMPFVISITGIAGRLNLGISSKPSAIPPGKMDGVVQRFVALLTVPEKGASWN